MIGRANIKNELEPISSIALYQGTASAVPQPGQQRTWALAPDGACFNDAGAKAPTFVCALFGTTKVRIAHLIQDSTKSILTEVGLIKDSGRRRRAHNEQP